MSIRKLSVLIILIVSVNVQSNPNFVIQTGIHIDTWGKLIQPDKFHLSLGLKQYHEGYPMLAFMYFKKSSALGNSMAQRLVGLMYINGLGVKKDLIRGYAWLKLASHDNTMRSKELVEQVYKLLKVKEITMAQNIYKEVNGDYGVIASLTRRDRWVRKKMLNMLGGHTGALAFAPLSFSSPHGNGLYDEIKIYVEDYNFGYVTTGEIIPKEDVY